MIEKLAEAVGRLGTVLRQSLVEKDIYLKSALADAKCQAVRFDDDDFVDLYDFVKNLRDEYNGNNTEIITLLDELMNLITFEFEPQLILANVTSGNRLSPVKGLSIYLPMLGCSQFYERSDFSTYGWGEFIRVHNKVVK